MSCNEPHPLRSADEMLLDPCLEVLGGCSTDAWVRCRLCGRWFWTVTDLGGRFEYVDAWELDPALAGRALLDRDPDAVLALLTRYDLPRGPIWSDERALLELLGEMLPGVDDATLVAAIGKTSPTGHWFRALDRLKARGRGRKVRKPQPYPFAMDAPMELAGEVLELPGSLVIAADLPTPALLWVRADGATMRYALPAPPRFLAHDAARVLWAIAADEGETALALGGDGKLVAWPLGTGRPDVLALDDGWYLFVPGGDGATRPVELRRPDLALAATFRLDVGEPGTSAARPRRMDGGWLVAGGEDARGRAAALTLLDGNFRTVAISAETGGPRLLDPAGDGAAWAEPTTSPGTLEHWVREGETLRRTLSLEVDQTSGAGGVKVALLRAGGLVGFDRTGSQLWTRPDVAATAGSLTDVGDQILLYNDERLEVFRAIDGQVIERTDVFAGVSVLQDQTGAVYLSSGPGVRVYAGGRVQRRTLPWEAKVVTTCGDGAVLRQEGGDHCLVVGHDGELRGGFEAPGANFCCIPTRAGPYVLGLGRLRVGAFAAAGAGTGGSR